MSFGDLLLDRPKYVIEYPWQKPLLHRAWPAPEYYLDIASDQRKNIFLNGLEIGTKLGATAYEINLGQTLRSGLFEPFKFENIGRFCRFVGVGQVIGIGIVAAMCVWKPQEIDKARVEHKALIKAEKKGDIEDLKHAFGVQDFEKFRSGPSLDTTTRTCFVLSASCLLATSITGFPKSLARELHLQRLSLKIFVPTTACAFGIWAGNTVHRHQTGSLEARRLLGITRDQKWKNSRDAIGIEKMYKGGDHMTWIEKFRQEKEKGLSQWDNTKSS